MSALLKHTDNGTETLEVGYTGVLGYLKDGYTEDSLIIGETGQPGLTGFGPGRSLVGALNHTASKIKHIIKTYAELKMAFETRILNSVSYHIAETINIPDGETITISDYAHRIFHGETIIVGFNVTIKGSAQLSFRNNLQVNGTLYIDNQIHVRKVQTHMTLGGTGKMVYEELSAYASITLINTATAQQSFWDNTNGATGIGYTGPYGYLEDANMSEPLYFSETGQQGLTGFGDTKSIIGALNSLAEENLQGETGVKGETGIPSPWTKDATTIYYDNPVAIGKSLPVTGAHILDITGNTIQSTDAGNISMGYTGINIDPSMVYGVGSNLGASGTFTSNDGKTITVTKGIITSIV
jgi:hypothetical protein